MKMKKILSLVLVLMLCFAPMSALAAEETAPLTGEQQYEKLLEILEEIRTYGLYSSEDDDPLKDYFVHLFETDPDAFAAVADGIMKAQDFRSGYYDPELYQQLYGVAGSYVGVGIGVLQLDNGEVAVDTVASGGPAEKAGLLPGDVITHIDGVSIKGYPASELGPLIRGEAGTTVSVTVRRAGESLTFTMLRAQITPSTMAAKVLEDGTGYIRITQFQPTSMYFDFIFAYEDLLMAKCRTIIIDVRDNPGGEVAVALSMVDDFVEEEGVPLYDFVMREALGSTERYESTGVGITPNQVLILANENSASASELLATCLRNLIGAKLVGTQTYGKNTGQMHVQLSDGSMLVITALAGTLPDGENYDGVGLVPDYEVKNLPVAEFAPLSDTPVYLSNYSDQAKAVNQRLTYLGYLLKPDYTLSSFDTETLNALAAYQKDKGLKVSGYADGATIAALRSDMEGEDGVLDMQLMRALALARKVKDDPLPFDFDSFGSPVKRG